MEFVECDQMGELVRGGNGEFIQAGRGSCQGSMRQILFEGLEMLSADVTNTTIVHAAADPKIEVVHLPLRWTGEMRWNGRRIDRPTAIVWGKHAEWSRIASDSSVVTLGFDRELLFASLAAWTGSDPEDWWGFDGDILNATDGTRKLLTTATAVVELSQRSPEAFQRPGTRREIRDSLMQALFLATSPKEDSRPERLSTNRRRDAVFTAIEYLRAHEPEEVSQLDLCAVTGVSARTLAYAFEEQLKTSPFQYLQNRRLQRARSLLRRVNPGETSVTACALDAGFSHLGRFSVAYGKHFGESPSTTLARSSG